MVLRYLRYRLTVGWPRLVDVGTVVPSRLDAA